MENDPFVRKSPTHYGIKHEPLMVKAVASNKREGQVVAFIGKQLCFFENDGLIPKIGETVEVMITRPIFGRYNQHDIDRLIASGATYIPSEGTINRGKLTAVLIRPVDPDKHQLMAINGFECSGTMCRTTTSAIITDGSRAIPVNELILKDKSRRRSISLTPGRCGIREAHNVNAGYTRKQPYQELVPTNVYVDKALMEEKSSMFYIAGMTRVEDCEYSKLFKI